MEVLSDEEIRSRLGTLAGWQYRDGAIVRELRFDGFPAAVAFVVTAGFAAEAANHHPDLDIRYNRVRVALSTHSAGGVTAADFDLAATLDGITPS